MSAPERIEVDCLVTAYLERLALSLAVIVAASFGGAHLLRELALSENENGATAEYDPFFEEWSDRELDVENIDEQFAPPPTDVVFMVDVSPTMDWYHDAVAEAIAITARDCRGDRNLYSLYTFLPTVVSSGLTFTSKNGRFSHQLGAELSAELRRERGPISFLERPDLAMNDIVSEANPLDIPWRPDVRQQIAVVFTDQDAINASREQPTAFSLMSYPSTCGEAGCRPLVPIQTYAIIVDTYDQQISADRIAFELESMLVHACGH